MDHATHKWTGRHPHPPCITDQTDCELYQRARADEDHQIQRYTD